MTTLRTGQKVRLDRRLRVISREEACVVSVPPGEWLMITDNEESNRYVTAEWNSQEVYVFKQDLVTSIFRLGLVQHK